MAVDGGGALLAAFALRHAITALPALERRGPKSVPAHLGRFVFVAAATVIREEWW